MQACWIRIVKSRLHAGWWNVKVVPGDERHGQACGVVRGDGNSMRNAVPRAPDRTSSSRAHDGDSAEQV